MSDWIDMSAGKHYYMEGHHLEGGGNDYFTVSMEFQGENIAGNHPHTTKEV